MIGPFVDTGWLAEHLDEVVTADVRWYLDGRSAREAYLAGHLPGAVFVDLDTVLAAPASPQRGRHPLPEPDAFAATLGQLGSVGSGRMPFAHRALTLPWVSWPSRVVRSIIEIAVSMAQRFASVLIDRVESAAARACAPTWSTPGNPCRNRRRPALELATSVGIADVVSVIDSPYRRSARLASSYIRTPELVEGGP